DPINELGFALISWSYVPPIVAAMRGTREGAQLYALVRNDPANVVDSFGLIAGPNKCPTRHCVEWQPQWQHDGYKSFKDCYGTCMLTCNGGGIIPSWLPKPGG